MIQYVDSSSNLLYLINQFKSFTNLLKCIEFFKEKIINLLKPEKKVINLGIINLQPEKKDLKINLDNINQIKAFSHLNQFDFLKLPDNLYLNFISMCENMENLDKLKNILSKNNNLSLKVKEKFEEKEHILYEKMIKYNNYLNIKMLEYINKDPYYKKEKIYTRNYIYLIISHVNFEELKKKGEIEINNFFKLFNELRFDKIFADYLYIDLICGLVDKIKKFDDFRFVFLFVDFPSKKWQILNVVQRKFIRLLRGTKGKNPNIQEYSLQYISLNLQIGYQNEVIEVLSTLNDTVTKELAKIIVIQTLDKTIETQKKLIEFIVNYFEKDINGVSEKAILFILGKFQNNHNFYLLFKKFTPLIMKDDDIYSEKKTEKFKIFESIKNFGFYEQYYNSDIEYIKGTKDLIIKIYNDLNNLNIDNDKYMTIKKLKDNFKQRISLLFENKNIEDLYNKIMNQIDKILKSKDILEEIIQFLKIYYPNSPDKQPIINLKRELGKIKLLEYADYEKNFIKYQTIYGDNSIKYNKFNNSKFFQEIFKMSEEKEHIQKLEHTEQLFKKLIYIFDGQFKEIDPKVFEVILDSIKSRKKLKKEMDYLKKYFGKDDNTEDIEETLMLLSSKKRMEISLNGIKLLINELEVQNKGEFYNKIEDILVKIKGNPQIEELSEMVKFLKQSKIDVMGEKSYMVILNQLTNKEEFIKFMKDKEVEGLRNLVEFVGEDDNSSLKSSDIQDFIKCIEFIVKLKTYANLSDKEFFDKFIEETKNNQFKNIEGYIKKSNQNFYEIKDLYTKNIDKSEFTKQKVKDIYAQSIFLISNDGEKYDCKVNIIYKDQEPKNMSFEEVLEVRDRALLKKKRRRR